MQLCGCIVEGKKDDAIDTIKQSNADLVELRIDKLDNPEDAVEIISRSSIPVIATYRGEAQADILKKAIMAGAAYVDIELGLDEATYNMLADLAKEKGCKVICSFHDFEKTPGLPELEKVRDDAEKRGDLVKIVTHADSVEDCHRVLGLMIGKENVVAFCMGEKGRFTRIVSLLYGAPFTYCRIKGEAAKGQFSIEEARELLGRLGA